MHGKGKSSFVLWVGFLPAFLFMGCKKEVATSGASVDPAQAQIARGKSVYMGACIACHHSDPRQAGALGPEIAGSSKELLEARIMRAQYPDGYTPKRPSRTMVALPHLKDDIDSLHSYLNSP